MADVETLTTPPKKPGCLKVAGFGCLIVVIIALGMAFMAMRNWEDYKAAAASKGVEIVANQLFERLALEETLRQSLRPIMTEYAGEIARGRMNPEEALAAAAKLGGPQVIGPLSMQGLKSKYLPRSGLSETEKAAFWQDATRFAHGLGEGTINSDHLRKVLSLLNSFNPNRSGDEQADFFAGDYVSDENLKVLWHEIKASADEHKIAQKTFTLDIAKRLQVALDQVRAARKSSEDGEQNI